MQKASRGWLTRLTRECPVCFEAGPWLHMTSLQPAACSQDKRRCPRLCTSCATSYVDGALKEGRLYLACPGVGCKNLIKSETIRQVCKACRRLVTVKLPFCFFSQGCYHLHQRQVASVAAFQMYEANRRLSHAARLESLATEDAGFQAFATQHTRRCPGCSVRRLHCPTAAAIPAPTALPLRSQTVLRPPLLPLQA